MYFLAGDSERWLPSQEAAGSPCSLVYPKTFSMKTNSRIGKRSLDNFPPHLENKMPNVSVPNIEPHGIEKLVECTQFPFNKWVNTSLEKTREKNLSIGLDENSGLLSQWKFSVVSKKVEYYKIIMERGAEQGRVIIVYLRFVYLVNGEQNHQQHHRSFPGASLWCLIHGLDGC